MASRQEKEKRAEAAAGLAADDLRDINREREYEQAAGYRIEATEQDQPQRQEERRGVIGSVLKVVTGTLEHAKEAVVGKSQETAETAREGTESAAEKAKEYKDCTTDKARETTNKAGEKVQEYDDAANKAQETKESANGEKVKETKDSAMGKMGEYKDYAAEKAKEAKQIQFTEQVYKSMLLQEKLSETEEAARQKMEELKLRGEEYKDEAGDRGGHESSEHTGEYVRGHPSKGKGGILSTVTDVIKSKLTQPTDVVEQTRAAREHGGVGRRGELEKVEMKVEETPPGEVASSLKAADQMSGQTFNDVGRLDDEGVIRLERTGRQGKM